MQLVRSRLGKNVDHAAREAAILGTVVVRDDAKFLHGIGVGRDIPGVSQAGHIGTAVEIIIDRSGAAIGAAVYHGALLRISEDDAVG